MTIPIFEKGKLKNGKLSERPIPHAVWECFGGMGVGKLQNSGILAAADTEGTPCEPWYYVPGLLPSDGLLAA
jgi:hypothetical protein